MRTGLTALALVLCVGCGRVAGPTDADEPRCGNATTDAELVIAQSERPRPDLGLWHTDPQLGGCVARVSDHELTPDVASLSVSPSRQAWNSDGTRILLASGHVLDAVSFRPVGEVPMPAVWAPNDPTAVYYIAEQSLFRHDIASEESHELATFSEYSALDAHAGLAELSSDGRYVAVVGVRAGDDVYEVFTWDFVKGEKSSALAGPVDFVHRATAPRWARMSPSGRFVVVAWPEAGSEDFHGIEVFDPKLARLGHVSEGDGDADITVDENGIEWLVDESPGENGPVIKKTALPGGSKSQELLSLEWFHSVRISCRAEGADECVLSTQGDPTGDWQPFENEVFALALDSTPDAPGVARLAHHHSAPDFVSSQPPSVCALSPEAVLSSPTLSRDGNQVLFTSNWSSHCFGELYLIQR